MISIRSSADLARALDEPLDPAMRALLTLRRDQLTGGGDVDLGDLAHFILARCSDTLPLIVAETGFPLTGDEAPIEWVQRHPGGILEAAIITTDEGFAVVIFVKDCILTDPDLLRALLAHA